MAAGAAPRAARHGLPQRTAPSVCHTPAVIAPPRSTMSRHDRARPAPPTRPRFSWSVFNGKCKQRLLAGLVLMFFAATYALYAGQHFAQRGADLSAFDRWLVVARLADALLPRPGHLAHIEPGNDRELYLMAVITDQHDVLNGAGRAARAADPRGDDWSARDRARRGRVDRVGDQERARDGWRRDRRAVATRRARPGSVGPRRVPANRNVSVSRVQ